MSVFLGGALMKNPTMVKRQDPLLLKSIKTNSCIQVRATKRTSAGKELH